MKAALGIDIGTSAVKVLLLGLDGDVLAECAASYPTARPHSGWAEQSPADWWRATLAAISDVRGASPVAEIVAVGLTGQLNGFVLLDDADTPLGDAPIWLDTRAVAETTEIERAFGKTNFLSDMPSEFLDSISRYPESTFCN